jgi:hypothetical protein
MNYLLGEQTVAGLRPERPCLLPEKQRCLRVAKKEI